MINDLQNQSRCFDKFLKLVIASGPMLLAAIFVLNVPPALATPMQSSQTPAVKPVTKKPAATAKSPTSTTTTTPKKPSVAKPTTTTATKTPDATPPQAAKPSLEETRLTLSKWIETQQIISKERNDWQQGKEILQSRIELVGKEVGVLNEKITQSQAAVVESNTKRDQLIAENDLLKSSTAQLANAVTVMEEQVRKLSKLMPEPVAARLLRNDLLRFNPLGKCQSSFF